MDRAPTTSISARIVDPVFAAVVLVNVLLLFKAIKLWRRTRRHYCPWEHRGSRTPATEASDAWPGHGSDWWHSPAASEKERAAIEDAKALLPGDALAWTLGRAVAFGAPAFEMELLRKLRTLPRTARTGERLAAVVGDALDWKRKHAAPHSPAAKRPTAGLAAADLSHGEWACRFLVMGMRCGRARGGHPVKIERIGANDMQGLAASPGGEEKLRLFYRSLLEELCASLNAESAACGALLRSYEVFDMRDLSLRNAFSPVVFRFTAEQLKVVGRVYAGQAQRVAVINLTSFTLRAIHPLLLMLPSHVRERVHLLGEDWEQFLAADLDEAALAFLRADRATLAQNRGPYLTSIPSGQPGADG